MTYDRYMIGYKSVEVSGVKSAIKELRKIDPELRKQFNKDAKEVVRPVIEAAKGTILRRSCRACRAPGHKAANLSFRTRKAKPNQASG
jgi:hypothetical protein